MTDNEITKANESETHILSEKIKAIYPHITVSGDIDKPCFNIDWYDIKKQTMYRGYSSYKLEFVRKWLQENFEVVDDDIDNFINRKDVKIAELTEENELLKEEVEALKAGQITLQDLFADKEAGYKAELERLTVDIKTLQHTTTNYPHCVLTSNAAIFTESLEEYDRLIDDIAAEAVKEFAEKLIQKIVNTPTKFKSSYYMYRQGIAYRQNEIIDIIKEMAGEGK